jgi:hypothetical protein
MCVGAASEKGNSKIERMSFSDPGGKIVRGVESKPRKSERVPSSANNTHPPSPPNSFSSEHSKEQLFFL